MVQSLEYLQANGKQPKPCARHPLHERSALITIMPFRVIGNEHMAWAGCETRASSALHRLPGVRDVRASAETQQISVTIDPSAVRREHVCARLQQLGYEVLSCRHPLPLHPLRPTGATNRPPCRATAVSA